MIVKSSPTLEEKVVILGEAAQFDLCGACFEGNKRVRRPGGGWIYPAVLSDGKKVNLLKILLTNQCVHNCLYCANRAEHRAFRISFQAEELARLFIALYQRNLVRGLFLSSAVGKSVFSTMEDILKVGEILRYKYHFSGYIHLKILPGVTADYVVEAARLASRVSVNLEAPSSQHLYRIAPEKDYANIFSYFGVLKKLAEQKKIPPRLGVTTQLVVGPGGETDREIVQVVSSLYRQFGLSRAYFSAFQPLSLTPLADYPPTPLEREHRLYQADFLLRRYGFSPEEFVFEDDGQLSSRFDPKLAWAKNHPEFFPVEINSAPYPVLIRVPGIGPTSANKIIRLRRKNKFSALSELKRLGVRANHCAPFILLNGKKPRVNKQLSLWEGI